MSDTISSASSSVKQRRGISGLIKKVTTSDAWQGTFQRKKSRNKTSSPKDRTVKSSIFGQVWDSLPVRVLTFPLRNKYFRLALIAGVVAVVGAVILFLNELPSPHNLTSGENFAVSSQIFDRNGQLLYEIFADEHRVPVDLESLPPHVAQATVAIEDERFYSHLGVDFIGISRAAINNFQGKPIEGGSTITQQLVKNALLTREKTITRKVKEAFLAVITEIFYSKPEILEMYLNYISYGGTAVGIEAASQQYFDKPASELTLAEAALLAGLPQAPSTYSPFGSNPERAEQRQATVLDKMAQQGFITSLQAEEAKAEKLQYALSVNDIKAPHFVFYVRDLLYEQYGVETVEKGGLRVTTTLDLNIQEAAQASVSAEVDSLERYRVGNGAAMVVKPNTGEILAMVGSRDYFAKEHDGQVNVTLAQRQPGSSIKPLMYATAFQNKVLNPGSVLLDVPTCFQITGQEPYCPKNYDGSFRGPVTIRQSLGNSLNIPAVKSLKILGVSDFMDLATSMGITSWTDPSRYGLSLTLGGGEVRMIDLAQAFSVIANQGVKVPLSPLLSVKDYQGNVLYEMQPQQRLETLADMTDDPSLTKENDLTRVMDPAPAYLTAHIMQDNTARQAAFGSRSELVIPDQIVSAKTGTTNDLRDNWTVGFTPEFLAITWVGNNDNSTMNQSLVSGVTGAAPIWNDIMSFILEGREPVWQEKPNTVASGEVCMSGMPRELSPSESCAQTSQEMYWEESQPSEARVYRKEYWVHADTGLPFVAGESTDNLRLEEHTFYADPVTPDYCLDCTQPSGPDGQPVSTTSTPYTVSEFITTESSRSENSESQTTE